MITLAALNLVKDGCRLDPLDTIVRIGGLLAAYIAFSAIQRFVIRHPLLRNVRIQLNLLMLAVLSVIFLYPLFDRVNVFIGHTLGAATAFLTVTIALKLVDRIFFDMLAQSRKKAPVPLLVRDLGRWSLSLMALVIIVRSFFPDVNLSVLAVSSLVAGYIVGNATQDTLGNLVAGLALNTEPPFQIGDWVLVGGHTGIVVDTTWRATTLRTKGDDYIVIPNASIAREPITNYSRPTRCHGCYCNIGTDYDSPPNVVRETILSTLAGIPDVVKTPVPEVQLMSYGDCAINFRIKFFIEDFARLDPVQSLVMDRLWYAFKRSGISIPFPIRDVRMRDLAADGRAEQDAQRKAVIDLFNGVSLFDSLSNMEHESLADVAHAVPFAVGEELCRQNESGDSFYIIRKGRVAVSVSGVDGKPVPVAGLERGAFFGEMSLLTGEARSATVTAETDVEVLVVSKSDFSGLLHANAALAGKLAAVLEKRMADRHEKMVSAPGKETVAPTQSALTARILRFFDL